MPQRRSSALCAMWPLCVFEFIEFPKGCHKHISKRTHRACRTVVSNYALWHSQTASHGTHLWPARKRGAPETPQQPQRRRNIGTAYRNTAQNESIIIRVELYASNRIFLCEFVCEFVCVIEMVSQIRIFTYAWHLSSKLRPHGHSGIFSYLWCTILYIVYDGIL